MNKNRIRLTESQLHRVIKESVSKVLNNEWLDNMPQDLLSDFNTLLSIEETIEKLVKKVKITKTIEPLQEALSNIHDALNLYQVQMSNIANYRHIYGED